LLRVMGGISDRMMKMSLRSGSPASAWPPVWRRMSLILLGSSPRSVLFNKTITSGPPFLLNEITAADVINVHIMLAAVWSEGERGAGHCVTDCGDC